MAAAVVSGAVAQVLQAEPKLTPAQVKFALQYTAEPIPGFGLIEQGAGSLDVPLAAALATSKDLRQAPLETTIGGETVEAGQIAFANTIIWSNLIRTTRSSGVTAARKSDTIIWSNRPSQG